MKISYNWLKEYLDVDLSVDEMSVILTDIGLEVEGIEEYESLPGGLNNFVIAKVLTCVKHPNADKLSKTTVDLGDGQTYPIVCGAPNVAEGQMVVVAKPGARIYEGEKFFEIKKSKIRGEVSEGMICAEDELGLGDAHEGILVLNGDVAAGTPAADYFKIERDTVFEIGLTPNRADAASHIGAVRDLACYLKLNKKNSEVKYPNVEDFKVDNESRLIDIEIENNEACKRYTGITISGLKIAESPDWLKNRLKAIGLSPINNVVDVTNFVLHELGQPLHAFDADKIKGKKVIVKTLAEGTSFITLDEQERKLHADDLMICNTEEGMCMAGVFGGISSGVQENTTNIFLESAYFDSVYVRKTAKRHTLQTDASYRFERGTDPNMTVYALKRAALLIKELAGGEISSPIVDVYPEKIENREITIHPLKLNQFLGLDVALEDLKTILSGLDIQILSEDDDEMLISVPPYRVDVTREVDIAEEILRIYGYNKVEFKQKLNASLAFVQKPDKQHLVNTVSDFMSSRGFHEMMNNSLSKDEFYEGLNYYSADNVVPIYNPLSTDLNVFRQSLLFGALETVANNLKRRNSNIKLYEFGTVVSKKQFDSKIKDLVKNYFESKQLALVSVGDINNETWVEKSKRADFFYLKTQLENILERLGLDFNRIQVVETENDAFAYGLSYRVQKGKNEFSILADVGKVHPKLNKKFDIDTDVFYAEVNWTVVLSMLKDNVKFTELSKFPMVRRDLALLLDKTVSYKEVYDLALKTDKKLLTKVNLFDVFEDKKLGENKKSYALSFFLQNKNKTLTDKEIDKVMDKLVKNYTNQLGAELR